MTSKWLMLVVIIITLAGCGGGGGSTSTASLADYAGVWTVQRAGLPDNQLLIDNAGNVMVSTAATKSAATRYRVGVCSNAGVINVYGSWPVSSTVTRHIKGNGVVTTNKLALAVVVKDGDAVVADGTIDGSEQDTPPPPPYSNNDVDAYENYDKPPVPPSY